MSQAKSSGTPGLNAPAATALPEAAPSALAKAPTGIAGLDELTVGGLPAGRPTLVCGGAGCGKTLLAATFLVKGAVDYGEPGVFMSFEENASDLVKNVASLGYDLESLMAQKKIAIDYVHVERTEIEETGEYDLEGLFIRLGHAIGSIGARRVVLDTIENLFGGLSNVAVLRAELRRLFTWLKEKGVSAIVTGERGEGQLTRHGLEEYVSDCVILLDHRVDNQISTRRLRVVKYRGSAHGTNEYPFLIDEQGISVMPVTSVGLDHAVSDERVSSGIPGLDEMMGGHGFYRGSSVLVSGMAGSGKTSVAAHFAEAACVRGERCLFFAFEESPAQIVRNMAAVGVGLGRWVERGLLRFSASRPSLFGLEMHLAKVHREIAEFAPSAVVIDPISSLIQAGVQSDVYAMLLRLIDYLKAEQITALFTNLSHGIIEMGVTDAGVSSLMDTWLLLLNREAAGEYNRQLYVLKSRGMAHSNQVREFVLSGQGMELRPVYLGREGFLTGSARLAQEARDRAEGVGQEQEFERKARALARRRRQLERQIEELRADLEDEERERHLLIEEARARETQRQTDRSNLERSRKGMTRAEEGLGDGS
jgi:circadian clock protein KaiC